MNTESKKFKIGKHISGDDLDKSIDSLKKVADNYPENSIIHKAYMNNIRELKASST